MAHYLIEMDNERLIPRQLELKTALNGDATAIVELSERRSGLAKGMPLAIECDDCRVRLQLEHFSVSSSMRGTSLTCRGLADVAYQFGVFSGSEGSSWGRAIEAAVPIASAPSAIYSSRPTITVDCRLPELLDHVAALHTWFWWIGGEGLCLGDVAANTRAVAGWQLDETDRGQTCRLSQSAVAGEKLRMDSVEGVVLESLIAAGNGLADCSVLIGDPVTPSQHPARSERTLEAVIESLNPFMVSIQPPLGRGQRVVLHAIFGAIEGLHGTSGFRAGVGKGDAGLVRVPTLGVTDVRPWFFPFKGAAASALTWLSAGELHLKADKLEGHVPQVEFTDVKRFDIYE